MNLQQMSKISLTDWNLDSLFAQLQQVTPEKLSTKWNVVIDFSVFVLSTTPLAAAHLKKCDRVMFPSVKHPLFF